MTFANNCAQLPARRHVAKTCLLNERVIFGVPVVYGRRGEGPESAAGYFDGKGLLFRISGRGYLQRASVSRGAVIFSARPSASAKQNRARASKECSSNGFTDAFCASASARRGAKSE